MIRYFHEFEKQLYGLNIQRGDTLYIASDVSLLLSEARKNFGIKTKLQRDEFLNQLIHTYQQVVGQAGTLMVPVFTWDFCRGKEFDYRNTKSETGALSNWILENRADFSRTNHPMYSFMVWGKDQLMLTNMDNKDAWSENSPFAYLHTKKAKLLLLNVSLQRGFTFLHYIGRSIRVPYRYMKDFRGTYIDKDGVKSVRVYSMYVRDLAIESKEYLPDTFLEEAGVMNSRSYGKINLKVVDLAEAYNIVKNDLLNNQGKNCYIFYNYQIDWTKGATHDDETGNGLSG